MEKNAVNLEAACNLYQRESDENHNRKKNSLSKPLKKHGKQTFFFLIKTNDRRTFKKVETCCWIKRFKNWVKQDLWI